MTKMKFEELNLSAETLNAVVAMEFEELSPIQQAAIPMMLDGNDIIGQAQTGTGKTAAFAIPIIEKLDPESRKVQAIVLCPTRELAIQVTEEFKKLMKFNSNLTAVSIYGGQPIDRQLSALKRRPQVIVGTPGRTMDHMRRGSLKIDFVKTVVLDEADEMLDMGFREDIEIILKETPAERQTVMFSATMPADIIALTKKYQKNPQLINVTDQKFSGPKIKQSFLEVNNKNKPELLARLIDIYNIKLGLVFCNKKVDVDRVVEILKKRGYFADALHGDMSQTFRDKVMNGFRNGTVEILVATDVAGRGIDVNNIEAVFNYDLPQAEEDYIHRIGRTARAGKTGASFTFITSGEYGKLKRIERLNGMRIDKHNVPTIPEIEAARINSYTSKVSNVIDSADLSKYVEQIELLIKEDYTPVEIAAALLKTAIQLESAGFDNSINFDSPSEPRERSGERSRSFDRNRPGRKFSKPFGGKKPDFKKDDKPFKKKSSSGKDSKFSFKESRGAKPGSFKKRNAK